MKQYFFWLLLATVYLSYGQEKNQEPYLYEIIAQKEDVIKARIKQNNGNTKGTGKKSFDRWKNFWLTRLGHRGKFSDINKAANNAIKQRTTFGCSSPANWSELGPTSFPTNGGNGQGLGRMDFVKLHPKYNGTTNSTIYSGGRGGIWKSINNGESWLNMNTDDFEMVHCADIAVMEDPNGLDILLAATGPRKFGRFTRESFGLKRSTNGGSTWTSIDLEGTPWNIGSDRKITEIAVDPNADNRVYVSVIKFSWQSISDYFGTSTITDNHIGQLFVSEDYGLTWTMIYEGFAIEDIEFKETDSNTLYFSGHQLVKAERAGVNNYTFTNLTPELEDYTLENLKWSNGHGFRMEVEVTQANPNVLYVIAHFKDGGDKKILYKSTNGGNDFNIVNILSISFSWIRGTIEVSNQDANLLYLGGTSTHRSNDGGNTWSSMSGIHADTNDIEVSDGKDVFLANDAGVYRSTDDGITWEVTSEGLGVAQVYDLGMSLRTDSTVPDIIEIGTQDTNCMVYSPISSGWQNSIGTGGDGMVCIVNPENPNIVYSEKQWGEQRISYNGGISFSSYSVGGAGGLWITPMILDPNNYDRLLVGKRQLRIRELNGGTTGITIPDAPVTSLVSSGTLQKITALNVAKSDSKIIYVAYEAGEPDFDSATYENWWQDPNRKMRRQVFKTVDGGETWVDITPTELQGSSDGYISNIEIHSSDPNKVWISYRSYTIKHNVIQSLDGGTSWDDFSQGLERIPVNDIVRTPGRGNMERCDYMYLATDFGVYYRSSSMEKWECYGDNLPNAPVIDLEIDDYQNIIRCASFGRGVWESGLHPDDKLAVSVPDFSVEITCDNGNKCVKVSATNPSDNHWWGLMEVADFFDPENTDNSNTVDSDQNPDDEYETLTPYRLETGEASATFCWLPNDKQFYIKYRVFSETCNSWLEKRIPVPQFPAESIFHFEDENTTEKDIFCLGEDVFLDGSDSFGESQYHVGILRRPIGSSPEGSTDPEDYTWVNALGWTSGEADTFNLSELFRNNSIPTQDFEVGYEYLVQFAIANNSECVPWTVTYKAFTMVNCNTTCDTSIPINLRVEDGILKWDSIPGFIDFEITLIPMSFPVTCFCKPGSTNLEMSFTIEDITINQFYIPEGYSSHCFRWKVRAFCDSGTYTSYSEESCYEGKAGGDNTKFLKAKITPNPSNGDMVFEIENPDEGKVAIEVYNLNGLLIQTFDKHTVKNVPLSFKWNAQNKLSAGVYFVRFHSKGETLYKTIIIQ